MICENCKKENASLILTQEKKSRSMIWTKFLCADCYINLTGQKAEYEKFKAEGK